MDWSAGSASSRSAFEKGLFSAATLFQTNSQVPERCKHNTAVNVIITSYARSKLETELTETASDKLCAFVLRKLQGQAVQPGCIFGLHVQGQLRLFQVAAVDYCTGVLLLALLLLTCALFAIRSGRCAGERSHDGCVE